MRLTTFTDYSLRVLIFVAAHPERRATIAQIAQAFDISENHLTKVVHFLGKSGFLLNSRGRGGGLRLAKPADRINIGDVVLKAEGAPAPAECFERESNHCVMTVPCRLRGVLADAVRAFNEVLAQYTLADLVQNRAAIVKVLPMPVRHGAR